MEVSFSTTLGCKQELSAQFFSASPIDRQDNRAKSRLRSFRRVGNGVKRICDFVCSSASSPLFLLVTCTDMSKTSKKWLRKLQCGITQHIFLTYLYGRRKRIENLHDLATICQTIANAPDDAATVSPRARVRQIFRFWCCISFLTS